MFGPCSPRPIATLAEAAAPKTLSARIGSTARMPRLDELHVLLFGEGQPAQRAAQVDAAAWLRLVRRSPARRRPRPAAPRRRRTANSGPGGARRGRSSGARGRSRRSAAATCDLKALASKRRDAAHGGAAAAQAAPEPLALPLPSGVTRADAGNHHAGAGAGAGIRVVRGMVSPFQRDHRRFGGGFDAAQRAPGNRADEKLADYALDQPVRRSAASAGRTRAGSRHGRRFGPGVSSQATSMPRVTPAHVAEADAQRRFLRETVPAWSSRRPARNRGARPWPPL